MEKQRLGIYIHIPFCKSKCAYCDFCSHPPREREEVARYLNALMLNMQDFEAAAHEFSVDTVYIGGGTPTLLEKKQIRALMACVFECFSVDKNAEITIEANPGTVDKGDLRAMRRAGINRISFGLQSASDKELRALGRIHTRADFEESFHAARLAGFQNINVDLMYGIPHQTRESFAETLRFVCALSPEHISAYGLKIEEGTRFWKERKRLPLPDEETEYAMYRMADSALRKAGYAHYEISNFARPGFASKHNMRYWTGSPYLGFGVSAHSYFKNQRYAYVSDMEAYMQEMETPRSMAAILSECSDIDVFTRENEYVMLHMRLFSGVDLAEYRTAFGRDFMAKYGKKLERFKDGGFLILDGKHCAFTPKGMYVSNYILSEILDF